MGKKSKLNNVRALPPVDAPANGKEYIWPTSVPILEADDICIGHMVDDDGRHCLLGWLRPLPGAAERELVRSIAAYYGDPYPCSWVSPSTVVTFNDETSPNRAVTAKLWNITMARLGYVDGNPEAE